jgi:hypothetical protein
VCEECALLQSDRVIGGDEEIAIIVPKKIVPTIHIIPKQHGQLSELPVNTQEKLLATANMLSSFVFDNMQVQGTNILVMDEQHAYYTIVGRTENDGVDFRWQPTKTSPQELSDKAKKISEETWYIGKQEKKTRDTPVAVHHDDQRIKQIKNAPVHEDTTTHAHEPKLVDEPRDVAADIQTKVEPTSKEENNYLLRQLTRRR